MPGVVTNWDPGMVGVGPRVQVSGLIKDFSFNRLAFRIWNPTLRLRASLQNQTCRKDEIFGRPTLSCPARSIGRMLMEDGRGWGSGEDTMGA